MAAKPRSASKRSQRTKLPPMQEASSEPPLSRERIVAIAVELLDAQGIDGLTMRRLADRLGSGVMSLYWHVDNKEDVFDLALDSVLEYRGSPETGESPDWRGDVVHMLENWRARMLRHPWSASLLPRRALGPNILSRLEMLSKTLSRAGVADADLNAAIWSLWNYVMGATLTRASFDLSEEDRAAAQQRLTRLSEHYPTIERSRLLLDNDWDGTFRKGLDFLLDGLSPR
ncbi:MULTISPECIES: TetR/AcrR family transcriptional regulator [unclassified Mesorhizobium]|jgi:AcrR family transcriptional regulator|uniref:TetR/AcrR family transcriptional regulator n=1 Tax=unclassified Mesorhizobium TaxID=325217 RepID=UPI000FD21A7B|nr:MULTISPECIES: TetR/AcrR family transcriptional regulator C-terminal domain-containing protein [unclassified Mesorhizobium]RUU75496.1 TetR family transcriptional regulator [Mesorhizobium sp. M7A.F.Ca.MR.362.00.0.0]RUU90486.1 TetR family transcriptional regulator [Mesorhizobium sp. M7A.F.Ca.MR.176.00.0.0]RWN95674.1 MAG: TetR family transcriptional regulator [Mesorhizobium sp.]RWP85819.1 MAG: TetR family transcriptional regulator [Mesorhizobium sp.]TIM18658.1 MAG: TetR family transcriptional r